MTKVGVTGGIGSGKTYVCRIFETFGIPIYYADDRARQLMEEDAVLVEQLKQHFGEEIYSNGVLERALLAAKVFNNKEALAVLNSLVHPAVFRDTVRWAEEHTNAPYTIKEAALLYETGSYKQLDKIIVVTASLEERISRVILRDNTTREQIIARIANQMDEQEKIKLADYVIYNDASHSVEDQVKAIHQILLNNSK